MGHIPDLLASTSFWKIKVCQEKSNTSYWADVLSVFLSFHHYNLRKIKICLRNPATILWEDSGPVRKPLF